MSNPKEKSTSGDKYRFEDNIAYTCVSSWSSSLGTRCVIAYTRHAAIIGAKRSQTHSHRVLSGTHFFMDE